MDDEYLLVSDKPHIKLRHRYLPSLDEKDKNRTILVIPGWLDNIDARMPLLQSFQKISNVIMFEPLGYGKSSAIKRRGMYNINIIADELAQIISHYNLEGSEFYLWGSCAGSAIAYQYYIDKKGPKPRALLMASPESKFKTKWWFDVLNLFPYPLQWMYYKLIMFILKVYMKRKSPDDVRNIDYSLRRFNETSLFVQLRILIELVHRYDIRGREEELDIPQLILLAENDWFTDADNSRKLVNYHPKSKVISYGDVHRFIVGNEDSISESINDYINSI